MKEQQSGQGVQQQPNQQGADIPFSVDQPSSIPTERIGRDSNESNVNNFVNLGRRISAAERLMIILTSVMIFVTIGGVSVAYLQWTAMRGQLDEMKSQFQRDQRPYVMSRVEPMPIAPNQEIMVNLRTGNYGKSPAIKAGGMANIFLGKDALERAYRWFDNEAPKVFAHRTETIIPPGTPASHLEAINNTVRIGRVIGENEFNYIMLNDFSVVMVMRQAYLDGVGNMYWTDLCVGRLVSNAIVYCPMHNEIH